MDETMDAFVQDGHVEVHEESDWEAREFQVSDHLRFVNRAFRKLVWRQ